MLYNIYNTIDLLIQKQSIMKTQNNLPAADLAPQMENCMQLLQRNAHTTEALLRQSNELICKIKETGIDDSSFIDLEAFLKQCEQTRKTLHANRLPYTQLITQVQKEFVALENRITAGRADSPLSELRLQMVHFLNDKLTAQRAQQEKLKKNHRASMQRIAKREKLDDGAKKRLAQQADMRLYNGMFELQNQEVKTCLVPVATSADGYAELFKFWWQSQCSLLPEKDLARIFHPMLMHAKKMAAKGVLIQADGVCYRELPLV